MATDYGFLRDMVEQVEREQSRELSPAEKAHAAAELVVQTSPSIVGIVPTIVDVVIQTLRENVDVDKLANEIRGRELGYCTKTDVLDVIFGRRGQ